uniref:OCIA domain-containing protein 1 n=1 Tax=Gouania willdenowi TaxID=441366 RepID=A0A8C5NBN7_GOUWI
CRPASAGMTEEQQRIATPMGVGYIPTDEERMVLRECNRESLLYRSLPFSFISMAITQALVTRVKGCLFHPTVAGFFGYLAGKMSYMQTEIMRQRSGLPPQYSSGPQSELSDPDVQSFDSMFQSAEAPSESSPHARDAGYGYSPEPPSQTGRADAFGSPAQSYVEEEEPRRKASVLYEDLRNKNRENYEVTLTQRADTALRGPAEKGPERPKKAEKKNIYGDTWEE